jgi:hypothetical protein
MQPPKESEEGIPFGRASAYPLPYLYPSGRRAKGKALSLPIPFPIPYNWTIMHELDSTGPGVFEGGWGIQQAWRRRAARHNNNRNGARATRATYCHSSEDLVFAFDTSMQVLALVGCMQVRVHVHVPCMRAARTRCVSMDCMILWIV